MDYLTLLQWLLERLPIRAQISLARNAPQEETDGALSNTFNAQKHWMRSGAAVSYEFNWLVRPRDLDASALPSLVPETQTRSA